MNWTSRRLSPLALLGLALSALAMSALGLKWSFDGFDVVMVVFGLLLSAGLGLAAFTAALGSEKQQGWRAVDWVAGGLGLLLALGTGTLFLAGLSRGRQVRRFGRPVLPELRASSDWASLPVTSKPAVDPTVVPGRDPMGSSFKPWRWTPVRLLLATIAVFIGTFVLLSAFGAERSASMVIGIPGFGLSFLLAATTLARALQTYWSGQREGASLLGMLGDAVVGTASVLIALMSGLLTLFATVGFSRGRQIRSFGTPVLPGLRPNADWADDSAIAVEPAAYPPGLAEQWRENGKTEHASVAAFARLTLDLMALGAPPALIAAANQDALDEIRHTEICFSLARAIDGRAVSPAPFPEAQRIATLPRLRALALAKLAVDSLVDGALNEGVSARIIAKLARRAEVPEIRERLKEIAADEGRHAAHGWDVVEWCLAEGGAAVAAALRGSLRALPSAMQSAMPEASRSGAWEKWGIHGHALEVEEYAAARAHVVARVETLLALAKAA